jgi:hypothetical protein
LWIHYSGYALKKITGIPAIIIPDYQHEFEIVGRLAKYFKGGLSIPQMMEMTFEEVYFWYKIYERQIAESIIIDECKGKNIPEGRSMENRIDKKIKKWHKVTEE